MRRVPVCVWCLWLVAAPAHAAEEWTYAASEHFEVYTTGGDRVARDALARFERVHAFFADFLNLTPRTAAPTRLIVFSGAREYDPYRPGQFATAFYQPGPDRDYIVMQELDDRSSGVVVHEYTHLIARHSGASYPLWFNEGLADYLSTLTPEGDRMHVGRVPEGRLLYLREGAGALMSLQQLFAVRHGSREYDSRSHAGVFYAQSWALTHMLLTHERYWQQSELFVERMFEGAPSAETIERVYGRRLDEVARDLEAYIRRDRHAARSANYRSPRQTVRIPTRRVEPFEADLVSANLLANSPAREAEARAAFDRLAAQRPDDLALLEARADFERRHGHAEAAVVRLARAVDLGTRNPAVYRQYAMLAPERAPELLRTALDLAPDDLQTRLQYGRVLLVDGRNGQVIATLAPVRQVPASSAFEYFHLLATAYARLGEYPSARTAASQAARYADTGDETEYIARLLKQLDAAAAGPGPGARAPAASDPAGAAVIAPAPTALPDFTPRSVDPREDGQVIVSGRIRQMICDGAMPVLEIATASGTLRLLIDDGLRIRVEGLSSATVDLPCGPQDVQIRVGYEPASDAVRKTVGHVRLLDYRSQ